MYFRYVIRIVPNNLRGCSNCICLLLSNIYITTKHHHKTTFTSCSRIVHTLYPISVFMTSMYVLSAVKGAFLFNCFTNKGGPTLQMHITCHHSVHQFNYFLSRLFNIFTFYFSIFRVMCYARSRCCHFLLHPDTHSSFSIHRKDTIPL